MLVANLSSSFLPSQKANSIQVVRMSEAIAKEGHSVVLLGRVPDNADENETSYESLKSYYDIRDDFNIRLIKCLNKGRFFAGAAYGLMVLKVIEKLPQLPDLFYGRNLYALLACQKFKRPIIYESHAIPSVGRKSLEALLFKNGNFRGLVVISENLAKYYEENFRIFQKYPEKLLVASDAGRVENYDTPSRKTGEPVNVGYAGSLFPGKGIEIIVKLAEARPDVNFVIAGGTVNQIEKLKAQCKLPNLHFKGFIRPCDIPEFYKQCHILLAPYQNRVYSDDNEKRDLAEFMSPLKVYEYLGTKRPMILSNLSCFESCVLNCALAVPAENIKGWLSALDKLVANPELCEQLGKTSYNCFLSRFTWKRRVIDIWEKFFNRNKFYGVPRRNEYLSSSGKPVIVHIIGDLNVGGAEKTIVRLLPLLNKRNFEHRVITLFEKGILWEKLFDNGVRIESLNFARDISAFLKPSNIKKIIKAIKANKPVLIQTWLYHSNNLINGIHKYIRDIPIVNNIRHNDVAKGSIKTTLSIFSGIMLAKMVPEKIICCSEASKANHVAIGYPSDKIVVIPNGFEVDDSCRLVPRTDYCRYLPVPSDNNLILFAARYCREKDLPNFCAAAALVLKQRSDVTFLLCGQGMVDRNAELVNLLEQNGIRNNCVLHGIREDLRQYMLDSNILVSSSASEAFPNVVAEAMSLGTPCVATNVGDTKNIIGDAGIVVPPHNPYALADGILAILGNPVKWKFLSLKSKKRIGEKFSIESTLNSYEAVWNELVKTH